MTDNFTLPDLPSIVQVFFFFFLPTRRVIDAVWLVISDRVKDTPPTQSNVSVSHSRRSK